MRLPPRGLGGRLALGLRALIMLGVTVGGTAAVNRTGNGLVGSPALLLVLSIPGVYGAGTVATLVLTDSDPALARAERRTRGLAVAWGFLAIAGVLVLVSRDSISLSRPGSVAMAAVVILVFGATGAFLGTGFLLTDERGRLAQLVGLCCVWTPLFGLFAVALTIVTPYYWLVVTEASLAKALGAGLLALFGVGVGLIALMPVYHTRRRWREIGGLW